ncbi:hypothetical protein [Sphingomonas sp. LT1P40]|uniref:hypothetical protein n=1 Tax=Alteristakelama amylovorans TaxID=3096166 RepID=UPI002FCC0878
MRPVSIVRFEQAYLASIIIWVANLALGGWALMIGQSQRQFEKHPAFAGNPQMFDVIAPSLMALLGVLVLFWLLLWFFTARRASDVAKWVIVVMTGIAVLRLPLLLLSYPMTGLLGTALNVAATLVGAYAAWQLFRPDARAWFKGIESDATVVSSE